MFQKISKNKKWSKKVISLMLVLVVLSSINLNVLAGINSNSHWVVREDSSNQIYLQHTDTGEKILAAKSYDAFGNLEDFDLVEYANLLNNQPVIEQKTYFDTENKDLSTRGAIPVPVTIYTYTESDTYTSIGPAEKCTPDVVGPATISYGNQISTTTQWSASISLGWQAKDTIEAGASFGWNKSSSSNTSFGLSFDVVAGKTGYVTFRPRYNTTEGTLRARTYQNYKLIFDNSYEIKGHSPKKLPTGFTDGIFALKTF